MIPMKRPALFRLPLSHQEQSRLYWELNRRGGFCSGEKSAWKYRGFSEEEFWTLAFLESRYDPRLLAILIDLFVRVPPAVDPLRFKKILKREGALTIAAVIGEFSVDSKTTGEAAELFRFLNVRTFPVPTQLFYRNLYPIGGRKIEEVLERPLRAFKKWGFLASDPPLLKERLRARRVYLYDFPGRVSKLKELTQHQKCFRLKDYLKAIGFSISRQQALKDLRALHWIIPQGKKKGASYLSSY